MVESFDFGKILKCVYQKHRQLAWLNYLSVAKQCLGTQYKGVPFPEG
jgi:hypothetical protein